MAAVNGVPRGQLIRPEARIPQSMLTRGNLHSLGMRLLDRSSIIQWNAIHKRLLNTFGVEILSIEEQEIRKPLKDPGHLETILSQKATLAAALPAVALAFEGRGSLLEHPVEQRKAMKKMAKEGADLRAAAAELEVLYSTVEGNSNIGFLVKVGEGAGDAGRRKPGEGLNASLYPGQLIVNKQHVGKTIEQLKKEGVGVYEIATDPIDGTTKTVMYDHSALTSILIVDGEIREVPDVYMEKLTVDAKAANAGMDTNETLEKNVQALSDTHRILPGEINNFLLKRDRHPMSELLDLGINLVADSDGDLMPGLAPGARPGVYENNRPVISMLGDTGGAAEYLIAAAANSWLGGASHGQFVSAKGMKAKGWEGRYEFSTEDRQIIEGAGFRLGKNYPISELVDLKDGVAAFGGITQNAHFPQLGGAHLGSNYVQVDVLKVGASGRLTKRRITFGFKQTVDEMAAVFSPVTEVLMQCDIRDIRGKLSNILKDSRRADRLQREIGLSLYQVFDIKDGKFQVNEKAMQELGDERTQSIITNLMDLKPDWFV